MASKNDIVNLRYHRAAVFFSYAKFGALILAVAFVLIFLTVYRSDITVENFRYMIKYMDFKAPDSDVSDAQIVFDGETSSTMRVFKNDVAVIKNTGVDLYDQTGNKVFTSDFTMASPDAVCNSKYMLIYDIGGTYAAVFNSFAKLWEYTFDYPIVAADIDNSGNFCIATSEKGYTSTVYMFNSDLKKIYKWSSGEKYVADVAISGKMPGRFIIAAFYARGGSFVSETVLLSVDKSEELNTMTVYDEMPLEISWESDVCTLLTDKSLIFFDPYTAEKKNTVPFSRNDLTKFVTARNYTVIVLSKKIIGSENSIMIFSSSGEPVASVTSKGQILDVCASDSGVYQLTSGELLIYNPAEDTRRMISVDKQYDTLLSSRSAVLLAGQKSAVAVRGD